jgi:carbonic anhydrase
MAIQSSVAVLLAVCASRALASCAYGTSLFPRAEGGEVKVNTFGYSGAIGPSNWHRLDVAANALCATGSHQSPIDMVQGAFSVIPASDLTIDVPDFTNGTEFENLGTTVEVIAQGGTMLVAGVEHTLQQFHFHLPSEHLDNGMSRAMEMHMVWEGPEGQIAVIGTYIDVTDGAAAAAPAAPAAPVTPPAETPAAAPVAAPAPIAEAVTAPQAPSGPTGGFFVPTPRKERMARRNIAREQANERRQETPAAPRGATALLETILGTVDQISTAGTKIATGPLIMSEVLDVIKAGSFQTYSGSLTTPPCSEGVRWLVSDQTLAINLSTFSKARDVIGFNARFPQNFLNLAAPAAAPAAPAAPVE